MRTPENRVNWAEVSMGAEKWNLLNNAYGPQGKLAAAQARQPQSLEAVIKGGDLTITLLRSAWSGKVRVTANNQAREISLYSAIGAIETLSFASPELENKRTRTYEMKIVKTSWHRLKFVSESTPDPHRIRVKSIRVGDKTILPDSNGEFVLPFHFWNQFSRVIAATVLSFLGLTTIIPSIAYAQRRSPDSPRWQWFAHDQSPRAILKVKIVNQEVSVLPYQAIKYFLASLAVLVSGLSLSEGYLYYQEQRKVIQVQEQGAYQVASMSLLAALTNQVEAQPRQQLPQMSSPEWQQEDNRINRNNKKKNLTSGNLLNPAQGDWIWRSDGFPVSQIATKPKRILVMGDSFVWGSGYANMNDIWWRQLQRELIRRGYGQVEVIAAGLSGASTYQELDQVRNLIPVYKPDLVIWGYVTNDPDEGLIKLFDYKFVYRDPIIKIIQNLRDKSIFPRINSFLLQARSQKVAQAKDETKFGYEYGQWQLKLLEGKNFALYQKTVKELGQLQRSSGIPGFVMTLPSYPDRAYFTTSYTKIDSLFKAEKIPFYDTLETFLKTYSDFKSNPLYATLDPVYMWRINPANGHPGTITTRFYAEQAADTLEAYYPQVLGKRSPSVKPPTLHINDWVPYNLNPTTSSSGVFNFKYPESEEYMLRLPVNRPFVQLNLESPVALKEIRLSGAGLQAASLDLTVVDSNLKFDTGTVYSFDQKQGATLVWQLEGQAIAKTVNTIRLSATFQNTDRQLTLTLIPAETGEQP